MKLYRKIDETGLFIEDVLLENVTEDEKNIYIETPCPGGFCKPKWNGTEWIEGLSKEEIVEIKNRPIEQDRTTKNRADIDYLALMLGVDL